MILYVNGDSHSAGAEAVNSYCFAEDDSNQEIKKLGRQPHPDNKKVSYGKILADHLDADLILDAESASSNKRIIRTTLKFLEKNKPDFIIIGWSTWEREEWLSDGVYWQINAGGIGHDWPNDIKKQYKSWISNLDINYCEKNSHQEIYNFHNILKDFSIPHLFFTCYQSFRCLDYAPLDWNNKYLYPYNNEFSYYNWLISKGFRTVNKLSYHFGPDSHRAWADFLLDKVKNIL